MMHTVPILVMTLTAALAAPSLDGSPAGLTDEDYYSLDAERRVLPEQVILPHKRAALVLDRLLIALQKALHDENASLRLDAERDGPRTAPLRLPSIDTNDMQVILPHKRDALVLDRLLIALQKALHDENASLRLDAERDGPRTAPLRLPSIDTNDMTGLQRRGQGSGRGRVLRCYFNAVTCF